jgi:hypothetical protein
MICRRSDESVRVSTKRALSKSDFGLRTIAAPDVVAIPRRKPKLADHFFDPKSVFPTLGITNANVRDMVIRVLMRRRFVNTNDPLSPHESLSITEYVRPAQLPIRILTTGCLAATMRVALGSKDCQHLFTTGWK